MQDISYDDILEDETLAPLKRNHACLQCKKRKVKCDATRPTCSPCLRSHAHALRSASRNSTSPPELVCTYADGDSPDASPPASGRAEQDDRGLNRKKAFGDKSGKRHPDREKEVRREEEKEGLLARIAELEDRLARLDPGFQKVPSPPSGVSSIEQLQSSSSILEPAVGVGVNNSFASLFVVPANWPKNLPAPFLLEHLVETFFNCCSQISRMIHRGHFMPLLKLPPTHIDFPHPALLHAICALASMHTAWVYSLPPEALEDSMQRALILGDNLEAFDDFGLAQAESATRAIRRSIMICNMGPGRMIYEVLQAEFILSELYLSKGFPLLGWTHAGMPFRLIKALELNNKRRVERYKPSLLEPSDNSRDREERLATVWYGFITDSVCALNAAWGMSISDEEMQCRLPTSAEEYKKLDGILENPQSPEDADIFYHHPVPDPFVLVCKVALILTRITRWLRAWQQRTYAPGDEMMGMRDARFLAIVNDIRALQSTMPVSLKNVYRLLEDVSTQTFDSNLVLLHILPNIALCILYEPFIDRTDPTNEAIAVIQQAYESAVGILHLVPTNLDVDLIVTPTLAFSLYTAGRLIVDFIHHAVDNQAFSLAVRYRADLLTVQNLMERYGQKNALGRFMNQFLKAYLKAFGPEREELRKNTCAQTKTKRSYEGDFDVSSFINVTDRGYPEATVAGSSEGIYSSSSSAPSTGAGLSPYLDLASGSDKTTPESLPNVGMSDAKLEPIIAPGQAETNLWQEYGYLPGQSSVPMFEKLEPITQVWTADQTWN